MKFTGTKKIYVGLEYPNRVGQEVEVISRVGNSSAYVIQFLNGKRHTCKKQFLKEKKAIEKKPTNEIVVRHFYGLPNYVENCLQNFYNANPNIEVISREMYAGYDAREDCTVVTYFITYKQKP